MSLSTVVALLVAILLLAAVLAVVSYLRRPKATPYGGIRVTDAMWWLWEQLQALEPSSELGGIAADKPGYHNARNNLPGYDYSVVDPPDWGGPGDAACAIDWTFPNAQRGDYSTIALYTTRLLNSAKDPDDPRLDGWREFYGNADSDSYVEGYDTRCECDVTSDSSHLWHIHASEDREQSEDYENKRRFLSVVKGETLDQWRGLDVEGDGAVLLNHPTDANRLDLFYVGAGGNVWHHWYQGTMDKLWNGQWQGHENLGGVLIPGTLTAAWIPDASGINICALGSPDKGAAPPAGCGQYWGFVVYAGGAKSGWGSLNGVYGLYPGSARPAGALR